MHIVFILVISLVDREINFIFEAFYFGVIIFHIRLLKFMESIILKYVVHY